jgi:glutaredoxin 3
MSAKNDIVVTIYTRPLCGYCLAAKRILQHERVAFVEVDCSDDPAACERIRLETGHRTVPMIFLGDNFIGGCDDLRRLVQQGTLAKYPRTTKEKTPVTISPELLGLLVCPETHQPLTQCPQSTLTELNGRIVKGSVTNADGNPVEKPLTDALLREDGALVYPISEDIPVLLVGEGIPL